MYKNILKRDLKRKKTMNIILFLFIILATTFISSSVNNLISISSAMDTYIDKSGIKDLTAIVFEAGEEAVKEFAEENKDVKEYSCYKSATLSNDNCNVNGKKMDYNNTIAISNIETAGYQIFDKENNIVSPLKNGEVMLTAEMESRLGLKEGDVISIHNGDFSKNYKYVGCTKDVIYSSAMAGITRLLFSDQDYLELLEKCGFPIIYNFSFDTDQVEKLTNEFSKIGAPTFVILEQSYIKLMYVMDMVIAGVMLIVSICLILISVVILRFTIVFTLHEEFREIGVMKAIGIKNHKIRGIYIIKYFAISLAGAAIGFLLSIPFGKYMMQSVSENIVISSTDSIIVNGICGALVVAVVILFCYLSTKKVNKFSPIDAIRNGSSGERYKRRSILNLHKMKLPPVLFMACNDILSDLRKYGTLLLTFTLGLILIIVPMMTMSTLSGDKLANWFSMTESDVYISDAMLVNEGGNRAQLQEELKEVKELLAKHQIPSEVYKETIFKFTISYKETSWNSLSVQGTGIDIERYDYLEGTAPKNIDEIAITHTISEKLGAYVGDKVKIQIKDEEKEFFVTAVYQSMSNMGEGIRFHQDMELDYSLAIGQFATQIKYTDQPSAKENKERLETIKELFPNHTVQRGGEYVNEMMGNIVDTMSSMKQVIILVVLAINILVSVLMVKSFLTKETGEIGMLKAIGFRNHAIVCHQTIRIGIILVLSIVVGILISEPIAQVSSGAVFKMMGASTISFEVNPLEVYIGYPLLVLVVTLTASFITAQQIRRISPSETSNIE